MSATLIRTLSTTTAFRFHRSIGYLANGDVIAAVYDQGNDTGYFMRSSDRVNWTTLAMLPDMAIHGGTVYAASMAIDDNDDIHVAWTSRLTANIRDMCFYAKMIKAPDGESYTNPGGYEYVYNGATTYDGQYLGLVDIDVTDAGKPVIAVREADYTWNPTFMRIRVLTPNSSNLFTSRLIFSAGQIYDKSVTSGFLTIMRDPRGASGSIHQFCIAGVPYEGRYGDLGFFNVTESSGACTFTGYRNGAIVDDIQTNDRGVLLPSNGDGSAGSNYWTWNLVYTTGGGGALNLSTIRSPQNGTNTDRTTSANPPVAWSRAYNVNAAPFGIMRGPAGDFETDGGVWAVRPGATGAARARVWPWQHPFTWGIEFDWPARPGASNFLYLGGGANRNVPLNRADFIGASSNASIYAVANEAPAAPTGIVPGAGSFVGSDRPTLQAVLGAGDIAGWPVLGHWQIADNSAFTANVKNIIEPWNDMRKRTTSPVSETVPASQAINQGLKYIRARTLDAFRHASAWAGGHTFEIAHPPSTSGHTPTGNAKLAYGSSGEVTFDWVFTDPSITDVQSAYQVEISRNDTGAVVINSGKVMSGTPSHTATIPSAEKGATLRWRVRAYDAQDTVGQWSGYNLFQVVDAPAVEVTAPIEGATIGSPQPTVTWTYTPVTTAPQHSFRVTVHDTSDNSIAFQSEWILGTATTYELPAPPALYSSKNYALTVEARDASLIAGSDTITFSTLWDAASSPAISVDAEVFADEGYVAVNWTNDEQDDDFLEWRVYRRDVLTGEVSLVGSTDASAPEMEMQDWLAKAETAYEYFVVQVAERFGSGVESAMDNGVMVVPTSDDYWLIHPASPDQADMNVRLRSVIEESFTEEYEQETFNLIGRGRKTEIGDRIGFTGSLTCQIRDTPEGTAREHRLAIERLRASKQALFLRNPFGDLWLVTPGNIEVSRMPGVGHREYHDVTIPYEEVS